MRTLIITVLLIFSITSVYSQNSDRKSRKRKKAELKAEQTRRIREIVNSKNFVFKAESVNPRNTKRMRLLTDFGVEVRGDSVFSYLPYFGNNYERDLTTFKNSPMGFMQPISDYDRSSTNEGYKIAIKVKNENELINLVFHISKRGYTSLSASFLNRQSISYDGEILIPPQPDEEEN